MDKPTRERILDAAETLMRSIGLARITTKQIAQAAACSEGALYKHFSSKEELFIRVLEERLPSIDPLLAELTSDRDDRSITEGLAAIAAQAARFYESTSQSARHCSPNRRCSDTTARRFAPSVRAEPARRGRRRLSPQ